MKEFRDGKRLLRGAFPKTIIQDKDHPQEVVDLGKRKGSTQFFAVVSNGGFTDHFNVITPYGRSYAIKYALLPHIVLEGSLLMIILPDLQVRIKGRNLDVVYGHIGRSELIWIKQSPSGKDDGVSQVFISEIQVRGSIEKIIGNLKNDEE